MGNVLNRDWKYCWLVVDIWFVIFNFDNLDEVFLCWMIVILCILVVWLNRYSSFFIDVDIMMIGKVLLFVIIGIEM